MILFTALVAHFVFAPPHAVAVYSDGLAKPSVTEVWTVKSPGFFFGVLGEGSGISIDGQALFFGANYRQEPTTGLLFANGEQTTEALHPMNSYWKPTTIPFAFPRTRVIWSSPKQVIGVQYTGKGYYKVIIFKPNSNKPLYSNDVSAQLDVQWITGNPDNGIWALRQYTKFQMAEETGRDDTSEILFLKNLRRSPLDINLVNDISRPKEVLGEPLPKGMKRQLAVHLFMTPHPGLECGNAYTGKVLWRNKNFIEGHWVGKYVLAKERANPNYQAILDGKTGKVLNIIDPSSLETGVSFIAARGNLFILSIETPSGTKISCFKVSP